MSDKPPPEVVAITLSPKGEYVYAVADDGVLYHVNVESNSCHASVKVLFVL